MVSQTPHDIPQVALSYDALDVFTEQAAKVEPFNHQPYWPMTNEIEQFATRLPIQPLVLFLQYLLDNNGEPRTEAERLSARALRRFVNAHLVLTDEDDDTAEVDES